MTTEPARRPGRSRRTPEAVVLREVRDEDLDALYQEQADPASVAMAAFTSEDPADRAAFDARMQRIRTNPTVLLRTVTVDGVTVGSVAAFEMEGRTEVTYGIERSQWGRGLATAALQALLAEVSARPVYARAASDNVASLRVLHRAGFVTIGTEMAHAPGRGRPVEETILVLPG